MTPGGTATLARVAAAGVGVVAAGIGWGVAEARSFALRRVTVPVLLPGQRQLRVLHLSDIHLLPGQHAKLEWMSRLAGLEPDLVVTTGDNIASAASVEPLLAAWGRLLERPGVFVWGSNDYTEPSFAHPARYLVRPSSDVPRITPELPWRELGARLSSHGWVDLNHHRARLEIAGRTVEFRGTDDAHLHRDDYSLVAGPAGPDVDLSIGVTHAPYLRILDAMTRDDVDLIFAGHTHGGQVCLPWKGALVTNCDLDTKRAKGLHTHTLTDGSGRDQTSWLHVSAGLGSSPFAPYRIACRPEATLLTLVPRASD